MIYYYQGDFQTDIKHDKIICLAKNYLASYIFHFQKKSKQGGSRIYFFEKLLGSFRFAILPPGNSRQNETSPLLEIPQNCVTLLQHPLEFPRRQRQSKSQPSISHSRPMKIPRFFLDYSQKISFFLYSFSFSILPLKP